MAAMVPDLSLDIYALRGTEASLEQLLADLAEQAVKHAAADSTRQCLLALRHCSEHGPDAMQVPLKVSRCLTAPCCPQTAVQGSAAYHAAGPLHTGTRSMGCLEASSSAGMAACHHPV